MPQLEKIGIGEHQEHLLHLYGSDESLLTRSVGRYLAEGIKSGDGLLVIATKPHRQAIADQIVRSGADPAMAIRNGGLILWDVNETLDQLTEGGLPSWEAFQKTIGPAVGQLASKRSGLRAYGEMVGLLWKDGMYAAANRVEKFWNRLLKCNSFHLFCAYPIDVFGAEFQNGALDMLLCAHTHVVPASSEEDLQRSVEQAIEDTLGKRAEGVKDLMKSESRHFPTALPKGEASILWLRANLPHDADRILERAKRYYQIANNHKTAAFLPVQ